MSKPQFHAVLKLKRIGDIAWRAKSQNRIRGQTRIYCSIHCIEVRDIDAIEEVEEVGAEFGPDPFVEAEFTREAHVKADEIVSIQSVSPKVARAVGERVAVHVRVRPGKDIK